MPQGSRERSLSEFKTVRELIESVIIPHLTGWYTEELMERPDGVRKSFNTSREFYPSTLTVFLNGVRQFEGDKRDYIISGNRTVVFKVAPLANDYISVDYIPMDVA